MFVKRSFGFSGLREEAALVPLFSVASVKLKEVVVGCVKSVIYFSPKLGLWLRGPQQSSLLSLWSVVTFIFFRSGR